VNWDGEQGWDPEATIIAPTLPAPGPVPPAGRLSGPPAAFPDEENWRPARKQRHPARTALVLALVTGILAGLALTFDHGGVLMRPDNSDNADRVASLWHAS
jgi:hypothetical protein